MTRKTGHDDFGGVLGRISNVGDRVAKGGEKQRQNGENVGFENSTKSSRQSPSDKGQREKTKTKKESDGGGVWKGMRGSNQWKSSRKVCKSFEYRKKNEESAN